MPQRLTNRPELQEARGTDEVSKVCGSRARSRLAWGRGQCCCRSKGFVSGLIVLKAGRGDSLAERLELLRLLKEDDLVALKATLDGAGKTADASTDNDDL